MVSMANNTPGGSSAVVCRQSTVSQTSARQKAEKTRSPIQKKAKRHRKQTITSRLSDSGIEEDLSGRRTVSRSSPGARRGEGRTSAGQLGLLTWHQHYGDVGYRIQRDNETRFHLPRCLARQPQVTAEVRCKLVSWLIPVHRYFHLSFECCCLAVNIMDRFLASTAVAADCFQLLGITALLIASKQVEVFSPRISQLLGLCCDAFTKGQLCNLECLILLRLNFRLAAPTLAFFLEYHINCGEAAQLPVPGSPPLSPPTDREVKSSTQCNNLARRICELSLADYSFNRYRPSLTAACALRLSIELLRVGGELEESDAGMNCTPELDQSEEEMLSGTFESEQSSRDSALDPLVGDYGLGQSEEGFGPGEDGSYSLALECTENLKQLVSLNREALRSMQTMS